MKIKESQKKIVYLALILLIIAGIVVVALRGFAADLNYQKHQKIEIVLGSEFNKNDIESIASEVFENKETIVKTIEVFNDAFSVEAEIITDEEKASLIEKINEKYGKELKAEDISQLEVSNIRLRDIVAPYILPLVIVLVLVCVFVSIRYKNLYEKAWIKEPLTLLLTIGVVQASLLSIIAIVRIPFNFFIMPLLVSFLGAQLMMIIQSKEKQLNGRINKEK